jgi:hypothetical protein
MEANAIQPFRTIDAPSTTAYSAAPTYADWLKYKGATINLLNDRLRKGTQAFDDITIFGIVRGSPNVLPTATSVSAELDRADCIYPKIWRSSNNGLFI